MMMMNYTIYQYVQNLLSLDAFSPLFFLVQSDLLDLVLVYAFGTSIMLTQKHCVSVNNVNVREHSEWIF